MVRWKALASDKPPPVRRRQHSPLSESGRDGQPALVVELQRVVADLDLDQVVPGAVKVSLEGRFILRDTQSRTARLSGPMRTVGDQRHHRRPLGLLRPEHCGPSRDAERPPRPDRGRSAIQADGRDAGSRRPTDLPSVDDPRRGWSALEPPGTRDDPTPQGATPRRGLKPACRLEAVRKTTSFCGRRGLEHSVDRGEGGVRSVPAVRHARPHDLLEHLAWWAEEAQMMTRAGRPSGRR